MFTGIVQSLGKVTQLSRSGGEAYLRIQPLMPFRDFAHGESIAVNGACLTLVDHKHGLFCVYASEETLDRTNLGALQPGSTVNLERALRLGDSFGGHLVSGHIDGVVTLERAENAGNSTRCRFYCPLELTRFIVAKGSVALDGVSLTVNDCGTDFFTINIIPVSKELTTAGNWQAGCRVNLETDMIGKYIERLLRPYAGSAGADKKAELTLDFFKGHGF